MKRNSFQFILYFSASNCIEEIAMDKLYIKTILLFLFCFCEKIMEKNRKQKNYYESKKVKYLNYVKYKKIN